MGAGKVKANKDYKSMSNPKSVIYDLKILEKKLKPVLRLIETSNST